MRAAVISAFSAVLLFAAQASAISSYIARIPSAPASCLTCHVTTNPGVWNDFGLDILRVELGD